MAKRPKPSSTAPRAAQAADATVSVAGAAMSSLQRPGAAAPATSYDGAQAEYILRDYEGYVSVFASDADRKPLQVTGIEVAGLRRADQELLRGGITVGSQEQLLLLLEDLGS